MRSGTKNEAEKPKLGNVYVPYSILLETLERLKSHGLKGTECVVHWRGKLIEDSKAIVTSCAYPAQHANALGARVDPSEVANIYLQLYEKKESLLAQVHSHPSIAFHSSIDDHYPVMHKPNFLSIVVPNYGFVDPKDFVLKSAFYEYQTHRLWRKLTFDEIEARINILPEDFEEILFSRTKLFIDHLNLPSNDLLSKLKTGKIIVAIDEELLNTYRGQQMLVASVNLLARTCINIDVFLPEDNVLSIPDIPLIDGELGEGLVKLCLKINPNCIFQQNPASQEYDVALIVGKNVAAKAQQYVFINALGWLSYVGTESREFFKGDFQNPTGPLIAASLGSAEVVKALLNKVAGGKFKPIKSLTFSALNYKINQTRWNNPSLPNKISLDGVFFVGAGAIGMAVAYALASLPAVSDKLTVIDPESVEISNLNRYSLATITDIESPKVDVIKRRLKRKFEVNTFKGPYQQYPDRTRNDLAVVTVDNVKTRSDVQLDFPEVIINGGMYANSFTISRHDDFLNKACLGCVYPTYSEVSPKQQYPAVSFISMYVGALLVSEILKERVAKLRKYKLDNAFLVNDVFSTPKIGTTYLVGRLFEKSDNCSCHCKSPEVIKEYQESRRKVQSVA